MDVFSSIVVGIICCAIIVHSWKNNEPTLPLFMAVVCFISAFTGSPHEKPYALLVSAGLGVVSFILSRAARHGKTSGTNQVGLDSK